MASKKSTLIIEFFMVGLFIISPFLLVIGSMIYKSITFDIHCGGRLKRAANANTIDLAKEELSVALKYLEDNKMTKGSTAIFYDTPDQDIGFWYENIQSAHQELGKITPETTQLEKTNVLIKLRETLVDDESVLRPFGISLFPNNAAFFWGEIISFIAAAVGAFYLLVKTSLL